MRHAIVTAALEICAALLVCALAAAVWQGIALAALA